jgi:hypothetical protein
MSKSEDDARLRKIGEQLDAEHLGKSLEHYGARASTLLLPGRERLVRWRSNDTVRIPLIVADEIAALLFSLPRSKAGRHKIWSTEIENRALRGLLDDKPVNVLAREISEETGQSDKSTRRRLQEMKKSGRFKELKVITRNGLGLTRALRHLQMRETVTWLRARAAKKRKPSPRAK